MTTLDELAIYSQKEIERQFAVAVFTYPLYSIVNCGWLDVNLMLDPDVRLFWQLIKTRLSVTTSDTAADVIAQRACLESGLELRWTGTTGGYMPEAYAHEIKRRARLVKVTAEMGRLADALRLRNDIVAHELITRMANIFSDGGTDLPSTQETLDQFLAMLHDGHNRTVKTGIIPLDQETGGMEKKKLTILAGRPAMGKTALALQIARNAAISGHRTHYYSLEMDTDSLWARMACPLAGVTWQSFLLGKLSTEEINAIEFHASDLARLFGDNLCLIDCRQTSKDIWQSAISGRAKVVIVDHIKLVADKSSNENENLRLGQITWSLHDQAKACDQAILALCQMNRQVTQRADKAPVLTDLRDSGEIEQNADNVWMIHRPGYYDDGHPDNGETQIYLRKGRMGILKKGVHLHFDLNAQWFNRWERS